MKFNNPFTEQGKWFKGNIHTHTKNSDGMFSPDEIVKIYRENSYDFLFLTDHNKITEFKSKSKGFLTINGIEFNKDSFHILGLNIEQLFSTENLYPQQIINKINEIGGFAVICHPYWSAITSKEITFLSGFIGIEIFNNTCEKGKGKGYSTVHYDEVLQNGLNLFGFAVDDCHSKEDILGGFIMVKAKSLDEKEICNSIKNGLFYSSTGIIIKNLKIEDNTIKISFSPSIIVDFISYGPYGTRIYNKGKEFDYVEYKIKGNEKYIRIEITDKENKKGWTNPIFL
ncbi:MAG: CehA/McbA family metallohydrolase [Candidatus Omnitrophica bacterium]|nr:CehA/McbA family metallohydrolase [Candidatus Omnitrophota bacterium]